MQAALPASLHILLLLMLAGLAALAARKISTSLLKHVGNFVCGALIGFVWAVLFAHHYLARELPAELEGHDITLVGTIDSLPTHFERGVRFNFAVERTVGDMAPVGAIPSRLALSWYSDFRPGELQAVSDVQPGERWQLTVRLKRPHGNANPHGFDYEAWLLEQNLRATGYVRPNGSAGYENVRLDEFVYGVRSVIERGRSRLRTKIFDALVDKEYASVIAALVIGDQRGISQSDWKIFNRTGIAHLVSISGLHITMIAGMFASIVFGLWRRSFFTSAQLPLLLPAQKAAALAGALAALIYVALAGFGVPAQRTLYMLMVVAVALWSGRITAASHILCAALGVVVLLDPWAVLWPGFWLSFAAVGLILYVSTSRIRQSEISDADHTGWLRQWPNFKQTLRSAAHVQYAITLGLVPFTMLLFGQISLIGPVANAIAIPLVSFVITPLALAGSMMPAPLSNWMLGLSHYFVGLLAKGLTYLSQLPASVWSGPVPHWWMFMFALVGSLWLLAPRGWPVRWLGAFAWLPLLLNAPSGPGHGEIWASAYDVGQGMAVLVETSNHRMLYDTGPFYSPEADGGNRVIIPALKARGIDQLDAIVISHNDNDHSGGALSILEEIKVGWIASSLAPDSAIVRKAARHSRCQAGQGWLWDGVQFEVLHPTGGDYEVASLKPNARSCTLRVSNGTYSILLPGDIEAAQEAALVKSGPDKLRSTVLLVPHHGSGTSSTAAFLASVQPEIGIFQVGYRNRYRHPKQEIYDRYGELGILRLRNDNSGAIMLRLGDKLEISEYRKDHARYWYGR